MEVFSLNYPRTLISVVAGVVLGLGLACRPAASNNPHHDSAQIPEPEVTVGLFEDPARVLHFPRFQFVYENTAVLQDLRKQEGLDQIVADASGDQEAFRRLMGWVRDQWDPGHPDPYPPPDARTILRDIRNGVTSGFCAQYSFVLLQAIGSFGAPARCITINGHEVIEAWLRDEHRWVVFDPFNDLQIQDAKGRTLSALEIWERLDNPEDLRLTPDHRCSVADSVYFERYRIFAVWLRNDFVSQPMNFADFDRYRVWWDPPGTISVPSASLRTPFALDLYPERMVNPEGIQ